MEFHPRMAPRMERAYSLLTLECADVLTDVFPELNGSLAWFAGGSALFAGVGSPLTQAQGLGFDGEVTHDDIAALEQFYGERGSPSVIDVCSLADPSLMQVLGERGYNHVESKAVLIRDVSDLDDVEEIDIPGLILTIDESDEWPETLAEAFTEGEAPTWDSSRDFHIYQNCPSVYPVIARHRGRPAGGAALAIFEEVSIFFSTAVLPDYRGHGIQKALLEGRLYYARDKGCEMAMVLTSPGSPSQKNVEKAGFQEVYRKMKMVR